MKSKENGKRTFTINGKEYGSVEEMPGDVRESFEKGVSSEGSAELKTKKSTIVFNGVEYASLDEMPTYARNLYEQAMESPDADARSSESGHGPDRGHASLRTEASFSAKSAVAAAVIAGLALLLYYLFAR